MNNHSNASFSISSSGTYAQVRNFTEKELLALAAKPKGGSPIKERIRENRSVIYVES